MSPTQRTLAQLRKDGFMAAVVERWNQYASIRQDLFGFIDVLAVSPDETLAVQSTVTGALANHIDKLKGECAEAVARWLASGKRSLEAWGWGKYKLRRGGKAIRWRVRRVRLALTADGKIVCCELEPQDDE